MKGDITMASIFKKRNGWYYIQFCDIHRRPRQKQIALRTKRMRLAQKRSLKIEELICEDKFDPWATSTIAESYIYERLDEAIEGFLLTRSNLSPYSIAKYRSVLRQFQAYLGPNYFVTAIGPSEIISFLESPTRKAVTKRTYFTTLSPFLKWLFGLGCISENPAQNVRLESVPKKIPRAFSSTQIDMIVDAIEREATENKTLRQGRASG